MSERGGGPPEEPERTDFAFGELLIGAKFWFKEEQYIKMSVDMARNCTSPAPYYQKFNEEERVQDIT